MPSQQDIKLLWGRSGDRCAICRTKLSADAIHNKNAFPIGEQAHIVGEQSGAARGNSILTTEERNSYHNLILLCPNCHTTIDKNEVDWPIERLHMAKAKHELYVEQTLALPTDTKKEAAALIIASLIDEAVERCRLREWMNWTSWALAPDPSWPKELPDQIWKFREKIMGAVWPEGFEELKRALITFSFLINKAAQEFMEHAQTRGDRLIVDKFYQGDGRHNPHYDADLARYEDWIDRCLRTLREATKAANWLADVVRRDINPMFFAVEGKFLVSEGPFMDLSFRTSVLEFKDKEKATLPDSLFKP